MIVNIRGTGGAGKSTVVRSVMERFLTKTPVKVEGRRQPIGYICEAPNVNPLWVVGHYETACGGGDTYKSPGEVFASVEINAREGRHVIFEGIISQDDVTRTINLHAQFDLLVIVLDTPLAVCLEGIQARRDKRGDTRPLSPDNTVARAERLKRTVARLKDANVNVIKTNRDDAVVKALEALGVV